MRQVHGNPQALKILIEPSPFIFLLGVSLPISNSNPELNLGCIIILHTITGFEFIFIFIWL